MGAVQKEPSHIRVSVALRGPSSESQGQSERSHTHLTFPGPEGEVLGTGGRAEPGADPPGEAVDLQGLRSLLRLLLDLIPCQKASLLQTS